MIFPSALFLLAAFLPQQDPTAARPPKMDHVVVISVDGLRSDAFLALDKKATPNFHRLMQGASTFNARPDPNYSVTLPNHAGMLTGRFADGKEGHGWTKNNLPKKGDILSCTSIFHLARQANIRTSLFATKGKFILFQNSWPKEINTFQVGPYKDEASVGPLQSMVTQGILAQLRTTSRTLIFAHYLGPDVAGHRHGWNLTKDSKYLQSIQAVDAELGLLFQELDRNKDLLQKTAILLTSDHGGGAPHKNHHGIPNMWVNLIIPFFVWTHSLPKQELYVLNTQTRKDPSIGNPGPEVEVPPIRNSGVANLALALLGLPPISGSTVNPQQNLRIQ